MFYVPALMGYTVLQFLLIKFDLCIYSILVYIMMMMISSTVHYLSVLINDFLSVDSNFKGVF